MPKLVRRSATDVARFLRDSAGAARLTRLAVGDRLYAVAPPAGTPRWEYRHPGGWLSLGPIAALPLADARAHALSLNALARSPADFAAYLAARKAPAAPGNATAFRAVAAQYIKAQAPWWTNKKHAAQWKSTLARYVYPFFGDTDVADITKLDITRVLSPIWLSKPETARRVRQRIEAVMTFAIAHDLRVAANPAEKSLLQPLLPAHGRRVSPVRHHAALPYSRLGELLAALPNTPAGDAVRAIALTAGRSGEIRGARMSEFDADARTLTIPAARMKAGRAHVIPLSAQALLIFSARAGRDPNDLFFTATGRTPVSDTAVMKAFRRAAPAEHRDATVHGLRSAFRDWCAETDVSRELAERALAHAVGNAVEAAYYRTSQLSQRAALMQSWANYLMPPPAE